MKTSCGRTQNLRTLVSHHQKKKVGTEGEWLAPCSLEVVGSDPSIYIYIIYIYNIYIIYIYMFYKYTPFFTAKKPCVATERGLFAGSLTETNRISQ